LAPDIKQRLKTIQKSFFGVVEIFHEWNLRNNRNCFSVKTLVGLWIISPTCLCKAIMGANPKSVKIQSRGQYLFMLLGSAFVKASSKMLMKLTPDPCKLQDLKSAMLRIVPRGLEHPCWKTNYKKWIFL